MLLKDDLIEELDRCKINYEKKQNNKKDYYLELLKYAVLHNPKIRDVDMEDQVAVNEDSTTAITFDVVHNEEGKYEEVGEDNNNSVVLVDEFDIDMDGEHGINVGDNN